MKRLLSILLLVFAFSYLGFAADVELDYFEYSTDATAQAAYVSSDADAGYTDDLIPDMTSDTAPSGVSSASSTSHAAWKAFDDSLIAWNMWQTANGNPTGWLQYQFTSAKTIQRYVIWACSNNGSYLTRYPKDWTFKGSNNGSDWDTLDTQTNQTGWFQGDVRTYSFSNTTAYLYYRLDVSANNGDGGYLIVFELEMMEAIAPNLQCYSEDTIKQQGSYSLKAIAAITDSLNDTLTRTVDPTIDLSSSGQVIFYIYSADRTGSNLKAGIHDSGGTTTESTPDVTDTGVWQKVTVDVSGVTDANKDVIDSIIITPVNADASNTFYLDNVFGQAVATGGGNMELYTSYYQIGLDSANVKAMILSNKEPTSVSLTRTGTGTSLTEGVLSDSDVYNSTYYSFNYSADVSGESSDTCIRAFIESSDTTIHFYGISLLGLE